MNKILKTFAGAAAAAALLFAASCSDDDDTNVNLTMGNDSTPHWTTSSTGFADNEFWMSVQVTPQAELLPYVSDDDLMCATIGDEIRAVSTLQRTGGEPYFKLGIFSDTSGGYVSISYYCATLKRIYTIENWKLFAPNMPPTQNGDPYVLQFFP